MAFVCCAHDAVAAPYDTWTFGPGGERVMTHTAYEPAGIYTADLNSPQDMYFDADTELLYIADTGNAAIKTMTLSGELTAVYTHERMTSPRGVCTDRTRIYVAEAVNKCVLVFDKATGAFLAEFTKPESALFGDGSPFVPLKVAATNRGVFVVSEGSVKGVIQLDLDGEFVGYVGANRSNRTFVNILQQIFFSKEQQQSILLAAPSSPTNIFYNAEGLLYTVTSGAASNSVKKLNTLGNAIMSPAYSPSTTAAISVDEGGNIFAVTADGNVYICDSFGGLLFGFGKQDAYYDRVGSLKVPTAVCTASGHRLFVLDSSLNAVVAYTPTAFAEKVFEAVAYYRDGLYLQNTDKWEEILTLNGSFLLSYKALARANMKKQNYELAAEQFKMAEDPYGYSEAFWNIRNEWLNTNGWILIVSIAAILLLVWIIRLLYKRTRVLDGAVAVIDKVGKNRFVKELSLLFRFMKKPADAVYDIKYQRASSVGTATLLYVWFVALQVLSLVATGYLYRGADIYNTNLGQLILFSIGPLLLWIVANYFVSTVSDGEGKLKDLYISTIYALAPVLVLSLPIMILTNVVTYNEDILITLCYVVMYGWTAVLLFINYREMHDYTFWQTVKNLLVTLFAFAMFVLFAYVIYMLCVQLFGYISGSIYEVIYNVIG